MSTTAMVPGTWATLIRDKIFGDPALDQLEELQRTFKHRRSEIDELARTQIELIKERQKNQFFEELVRDIVDGSPDMLWAKDMGPEGTGKGGRFIFTNKAIRDGLLISSSLKDSLGKPDIYFAERQRKLGNDFTFGNICADTDVITLERNQDKNPDTAIACQFLESGKVNGVYKRLMVVKKPRYDILTGEVIGTVGSARDMTQDYEQLESVRLLWKASRDSSVCVGLGEACSQATEALEQFMDQFVFTSHSGIREK